MLSPLPRRSGWAYCFAHSPSRISLPRKGCRVGLRIVLFEACSAFTRVTACTLALSPNRDTLTRGFSHFVTSMTAPVASGWSGCRVGLAPTGKRRLSTAHTQSGRGVTSSISNAHDAWSRSRGYSGLAPENLTTLAHLSVSSAMNFPKSAGEPGNTVVPRSASRAFILGSASAALISLLSLSTISAGVLFAQTDGEPLACLVARHEFAHGRDVGQCLEASGGRHRQRAQLAGPDMLDRCRQAAEINLHLATEQIGNCGRGAAIGDVRHVDVGHHLEQLAGQMGRISGAGRRHADLARIGLGVGNEFREPSWPERMDAPASQGDRG